MSSAASTSARTHRAKRDVVRFTADGERVVRMDPTDYTQTFRVVEDEPARAYTESPTHDTLPGFGEEYETCGEESIHFCSDCGRIAVDEDGEPVPIGQTCWRKECPRCAPGWVMRRSYNITAKLESARKEAYHKRREDQSHRFHHVVVSMPEFQSAGDADEAFFEVVKGVVDEVGINVVGGVIAHHSHSGEQGDDRDVWKTRLFKQRDWEGDVEDEVEVRHHAHVILVADRIEHSLCTALYEQTGILTHRVEDENNVSLFGVQDLASAVTYALSHARVAEGADSYRYFGEVANHAADGQTKARMKQVVRSVVPKTLDLNVSDVTCGHESDDDDATEPAPEFEGGGEGGETSVSQSARCGGRLVPIEYAPSFLEDHDLPYADELREVYAQWDGAPPPD